jgi:glutamate synthase (NADPH/NADH) small chain
MDCGIPFCHGTGCPLGNRIPEFNDMIYRRRWRDACDNLHTTNNFPEITGRICPAPCEASCTLGINDKPVLIKHIEYQIVERGFDEGWIEPLPAAKKTGRKVAIIGSGPAGLAAAQQLTRRGHEVTVFEKDNHLGGLLRYGIPDFKLDKQIIERRIKQLVAEGVRFQTGVCVGEDVSVRYLKKNFDAICLTMGAGEPRDLTVAGRQLSNVYFAMEFLAQQNRIVSGELAASDRIIMPVKDRIVAVVGGGDTGSDCVGTAIRQGAKEVLQYEILPEPPVERPEDTPWPLWPRIKRTSTSHEEGCRRFWSVLTKKLIGRDNRVTELVGCKVSWTAQGQSMKMQEVPGTEFSQRVDMVLLAMGFVHVVHKGLIEQLNLRLDTRGNVIIDNYMTSEPGIFAAGDTARGASLVVHAINAGREAAAQIDVWLTHH